MEYALEIKHLSKQYKDFRLDDVTLAIPSGSVVGLIGENGAGKSTLIQSILGLIHSDYEEINIFGYDLKTNEKKIKEEIAVINDVTHFNLEFTPSFIGKLLSKIYKNWDNQRYESYLDRFKLPKKKKLKEFSKGMKMKLEFAVAFSHDAKFLFLDEATSGLDPVFRDEILDLLREFSEDESHTILLSSHITSDLDKIADYIAYLHEGRLMFMKTYDELHENFGILNCSEKIMHSLNQEDIVAYRKEAYSYKVLVQNAMQIRKVFTDLEINKASVEDIMVFYAKGEKIC